MQKRKPHLKRVLLLTKAYYPIIGIYSVCISVLTLSIPISVQSLVNTFTLSPNLQPLFIITSLLFGTLALLGLLQSMQYLMTEYLQRKFFAKISAQISNAFLTQEKDSLSEEQSLNYANRFFDIILIQKKVAFLVTDGFSFLFQSIVGLILIFLYHPAFVFYGILIVISFVGTISYFYKLSSRSAVQESSKKYEVATFIESLASRKMEDLSPDEHLKQADQVITDYLDSRKEHFTHLFHQNIIFVGFYALLNAIFLGFGGYLVVHGQLSVGQLVAAEIIVNSILYNFLNAKKYTESFYDLYAASHKVGYFFESDEYTTADYLKEKFKSIQSVYKPINYKKTIRNFALVSSLLLLFLALVPWQQTSHGFGNITVLDPNDRTQVITSNVTGRIQKWLVQDGDYVKEGQAIAEIVDNDPAFLERLEAERDAAVTKFEAARVASDTARLNFNRQRNLVKEGLSSPKDFEKAKITYKKLISEEAETVKGLQQIEVKLSRQRMQVVTAPKDGQVFGILYGSGSILVKAGEPIASFVPETQSRVAEIFIDGNDLPLLEPGRKVRLQFEGWPAFQLSGFPEVALGSFGGVVVVVDPFVNEKGLFRILIEPDASDPHPWPNYRMLRQGARVHAIVLLETVPLGYEIWRKTNGFPKRMKPKDDEKKDFRQKIKKKKK